VKVTKCVDHLEHETRHYLKYKARVKRAPKLASTANLAGLHVRGTSPDIVTFEVITAVIMKNAFFWDVTPCDSFKNQHFGGTHRLHHEGDKSG
jgi:hypothetical protein